MSNLAYPVTLFTGIRRVRSDESEFWSARELAPLLGYARWENFAESIERARAACDNSGQDSRDHFRAAKKMIGIGKTATRDVLDFQLSRYACYLTAMNGDPRKQEIASAQTYFALRTHEAEQQAVAPALPTDPIELLALSLAGLQQHKQQIQALEQTTARLETRLDDTPIRMHPAFEAQVKARCQAFAQVHPGRFQGAYHAFKEAFGMEGAPLARYDSLPARRVQEALDWLDVQTRTYAARLPSGATR